jgi:hypothetical protein
MCPQGWLKPNMHADLAASLRPLLALPVEWPWSPTGSPSARACARRSARRSRRSYAATARIATTRRRTVIAATAITVPTIEIMANGVAGERPASISRSSLTPRRFRRRPRKLQANNVTGTVGISTMRPTRRSSFSELLMATGMRRSCPLALFDKRPESAMDAPRGCLRYSPAVRRPLTVAILLTLVAVGHTSGTTQARTPAKKLTWAPPALSHPIRARIPDTGLAAPSLPNQNPNQPWVVRLRPGQDYVLELGHRTDDGLGHGGALAIDGGRNVVIVGGRVTARFSSEPWHGRGLTFENQTGVVHVEGVQIDGGGGESGAGDGLFLVATQATFQIQNVRIGVSAPRHDFSINHPDLIQSASARKVRIDRLTGITDYQGFFWNWDLVPGHRQPAEVIASNVNIVPDSSGRNRAIAHNSTATRHACVNCWTRPGVSWDDGRHQFRLNEIVLGMDAVGTVIRTPWRITGFDGKVRKAPPRDNVGRRQGDYIEWPTTSNLKRERWYWGNPPGGDFVPVDVPGVDYVSPGYR